MLPGMSLKFPTKDLTALHRARVKLISSLQGRGDFSGREPSGYHRRALVSGFKLSPIVWLSKSASLGNYVQVHMPPEKVQSVHWLSIIVVPVANEPSVLIV